MVGWYRGVAAGLVVLLAAGSLTGCSSASEDPQETAQKVTQAAKETREKLEKQLPQISFKNNDSMSAEDNQLVKEFMEKHQLTQKSVEAMLALAAPLCSLLDSHDPGGAKNQGILSKIYDTAAEQDRGQWYQMIHSVVQQHCKDKLPVVEQHKPAGVN